MVIRDTCIKNVVVLPLTSLLLQMTQFQWTQYNLMCSLVSMMIFQSCDCAWSSFYLPISILFISNVKACENNAHGHSIAGLERAPNNATDLFISIARSDSGGFRAVLCQVSRRKAEQGEPWGRDITRQRLIRCNSCIKEVGWENYKDAAFEYIKLLQEQKVLQEVSNVTTASQIITAPGFGSGISIF